MTYLGDAGDHVFDERFKGIDRAGLLVASEPHADSEMGASLLLVLHIHFLEFNCKMGEVLRDFSSGSCHGNLSSLVFNRDYTNQSR